MSNHTLLDLSRWQWALTAAFHITFPAVTVGTSVFLVVCYAMYMRTDYDVWLRMFRFWPLIVSLWLAEEQFACGLLERCRELPVGEAGFVEFAEGLVAREHEEEGECAGGCAVA
jgi:hypothetical protein